MKGIILGFLSIMYSSVAFAQYEKKHPLEFGDVFVLKISIKKDVLTKKCTCHKRKKCVLTEVVVSKVLYCPPTKSFDSIQLVSLRYVLFARYERNKLNTDSFYIITVRPSGSKYYLDFSKVLNVSDVEKVKFYHPYAYLSDISPCKQEDLFEKYILKHDAELSDGPL